MAQELDQDGRLERQEIPSRIERRVLPDENEEFEKIAAKKIAIRKKRLFGALIVGSLIAAIDTVGIFVEEVPPMGTIFSVIVDGIEFIWFKSAGMKITPARVTVLALQTLLESIPFVGNFIWSIISVVVNYYLD